jgi:H/ACA ribonucleoprotein complex subunit 4
MNPDTPENWNTRPLQDVMRSGVVIIDKPQGPSSHQVTVWVRDILGLKKTGHGGTLDPNVTGVLPVALQDATKALDSLLWGEKEYVCSMTFHGEVKKEKISGIMREFTGEIFQTPPLKSAVKRERRTRRIYGLELLEVEDRDALFSVRCQAGTYIRTLCRDIGDALLVGAHLTNLRRTRTAGIGEHECVTLQDLKDAFDHWKENGEERHLRNVIMPKEVLLKHLPKLVLKDTSVDAVCHGADLAIPGIAGSDANIRKGNLVALMTMKGEGVALGTALANSQELAAKGSGLAVKTNRVLMNPGTYPKAWKTKTKPLNMND